MPSDTQPQPLTRAEEDAKAQIWGCPDKLVGPPKGEVIQFRAVWPYIMGDRYVVHRVTDGRVYFCTEEPGCYGHGYTTIEGWAELKARAAS